MVWQSVRTGPQNHLFALQGPAARLYQLHASIWASSQAKTESSTFMNPCRRLLFPNIAITRVRRILQDAGAWNGIHSERDTLKTMMQLSHANKYFRETITIPRELTCSLALCRPGGLGRELEHVEARRDQRTGPRVEEVARHPGFWFDACEPHAPVSTRTTVR